MEGDPTGPAPPPVRGAATTCRFDPLGAFRPHGRDAPAERRRGAVARLRNATATSAGGVVVRYQAGVPQLVVGLRRRDRDGGTWTLPKGTPNAGETTEQTALREVAEETGLEVRITGDLPSIQYVFTQRGTRISKTVHYFLMEPVGGDLSRHDHEFQDVRWIDFADARGVLTFETERSLVAEAARRLPVTEGAAVAPPAASGPVGHGPSEIVSS